MTAPQPERWPRAEQVGELWTFAWGPGDAEWAIMPDEATARRCAAAWEMEKALAGVLGLLDCGWLVRDTSHDAEPGWSLKCLGPVKTLAEAGAALALARGQQ